MEYEQVYADADLVAVNKPPLIPTQPDKTADRSLYDAVCAEIGECWLLHRLDRPTSGLVLFVRSRPFLVEMNRLLKDREMVRTYWAVTRAAPQDEEREAGRMDGPVSEGRQTLCHYIAHDPRRNKSFAQTAPGPGRKRAELSYRPLSRARHYVLLEIVLTTGRHHQIRAQLAACGQPIKGDVKYGARRTNPGGGIHLHARSLRFRHPRSGENVELTAAPPSDPLWEYFMDDLTSRASG